MQHAVTVAVMLTFGNLATAFAQRVEPAPVNDAEKAPTSRLRCPSTNPGICALTCLDTARRRVRIAPSGSTHARMACGTLTNVFDGMGSTKIYS